MKHFILSKRHKFLSALVMLFFAFLFTTIVLPMMWIHYDAGTIGYYSVSLLLLFVGGVIFDIIITKLLPLFNIRQDEIFPKYSLIISFACTFIIYAIVSYVVFVNTGNITISLYVPLFMMMGGFLWFCVLLGYVKAKNETENDTDKGLLWEEKFLMVMVPLSLLLGLLYKQIA